MVSNRDIGFVMRARRPRSRSTPSTSRATACCTARCSTCPRTPLRATMQTPRSTRPRTHRRADTQRAKGQDLVYAARVSLDQHADAGRTISWSTSRPGMAVTAEIKTGSRRIISYLLSPLLRYKQESCESDEPCPADVKRALIETQAQGGAREGDGGMKCARDFAIFRVHAKEMPMIRCCRYTGPFRL